MLDGPEHMYYVLVDAGRTGLLGSEFQEMLRCIRCGACMNHCPVYQKIGGHAYGWVYPGPMGSVLTPSYVGLENALDLPHAATLCGQCSVVCPVKIPLPDLLRKLREKQWERGLRPWYERVAVAAVGVRGHASGAVCAGRAHRRARAELDGRSRRAHPQPAARRRLDRDPRLSGTERPHLPRHVPRTPRTQTGGLVRDTGFRSRPCDRSARAASRAAAYSATCAVRQASGGVPAVRCIRSGARRETA